MEIPFSWEVITSSLVKMGNHELAQKVGSCFDMTKSPTDYPAAKMLEGNDSSKASVKRQISVPQEIEKEFEILFEKYNDLTVTIQNTLEQSLVNLGGLQHFILNECQLDFLPESEANFTNIYNRLARHFSILNVRKLQALVYNLFIRQG